MNELFLPRTETEGKETYPTRFNSVSVAVAVAIHLEPPTDVDHLDLWRGVALLRDVETRLRTGESAMVFFEL